MISRVEFWIFVILRLKKHAFDDLIWIKKKTDVLIKIFRQTSEKDVK